MVGGLGTVGDEVTAGFIGQIWPLDFERDGERFPTGAADLGRCRQRQQKEHGQCSEINEI